MSVKVNLKKELGIAKSFEIKQSNKNIRAAWVLEKAFAKIGIEQELANKEETSESQESFIDALMEFQEQVIAYVVNTLHLTSKQAEAVDDLTFDETASLAGKLTALVLGVETVPVEGNEEETSLKA